MGDIVRRLERVSRWQRWLSVVIWMAIIFLFSSQPHSGRESEKYLGVMNVPIRKMAHLSEYAMLFVLTRWALNVRKPGGAEATTGDIATCQRLSPRFHEREPAASAISFSISVLNAIGDEWHQSFVPGRSSTPNDVLVDVLGVSIGLCVWLVVSKHRSKSCTQAERR